MPKPSVSFIVPMAALLLVACGSSHKAGGNTYASTQPPAGFTGSPFIRSYSQKLGIQLSEGMNRALIEKVADWMGVPYKYGGNTKAGVDCSGFIYQVFVSVYQLKLPRTARELHEQSRPVKTAALQEGDLVFFKINTEHTGHAGIYLLDGWFAHASTSRGVVISRLDDAYWKKYFEEAGRFL